MLPWTSFVIATFLLKSLATVHKEMQDQRFEIGELDDRMDLVEDDVDRLDKDVKENRETISGVRTDVNQQGERLDDLEEVVDETVDKVEDLDHKVG
jgi:chromosome segregation ATPase